jgi:hypothetical protein
MAGRIVAAQKVNLTSSIVHGDVNGVKKKECNESILICTLFQ